MNGLGTIRRANNPAMTKGHYELIARVIRSFKDASLQGSLARDFASELKGTNAAFDAERFIAACTKE